MRGDDYRLVFSQFQKPVKSLFLRLCIALYLSFFSVVYTETGSYGRQVKSQFRLEKGFGG